MPSPDAVPTPAELCLWLRVASPWTATGSYRVEPAGDDRSFGFAWMGAPPAVASPEAGAEVRFWHAAPDRWRLEQGDALLAVSDGERAVGRAGDRLTTGAGLVVLPGPADLLHATLWATDPDGIVRDGRVSADERLGRRCWRWERPDETWWVDHDSGVALAHDDARGLLELTSLVLDEPLDEVSFTPPDELLEEAEQEDDEEDPWDAVPVRGAAAPRSEEPEVGFTVAEWPGGCLSYPVSGDPSVPEVLLVLNTGGRARFWLGVTPAPRRAPARRGASVRRWASDHWSFALSWTGVVADVDLDRVVASVPDSWPGAGPR